MQIEKTLRTTRPRDDVVEMLSRDETLVGLFADSDTEIVDRKPDRRTTRTHYRALGREGIATFHFDFLLDGNVRFEKVCDGRVWRELVGFLSVEEDGTGSEVRIEMKGRTKSLVPEFTIKGPMEEQIEQMAQALRELFESER